MLRSGCGGSILDVVHTGGEKLQNVIASLPLAVREVTRGQYGVKRRWESCGWRRGTRVFVVDFLLLVLAGCENVNI